MEQHDIWRLAARLIKMFDDGAEMAAAMYADKALAQGDANGERKWNEIAAAIHALRHNSPPVRRAMS